MSSMNCHKGKYSCNAFDDIFSALESERDGLKLAVNTQTDLYRASLAEIDALKEDCIRLQQEINCLRMDPCQLPYCVGERDKLKAELEAYKGYETWDHDGMQEQLEDYKADRDRWKALAGKMAEALIKKIELHDSVKPKKLDEALAWRSNDELSDRLCNEVLSAYQSALEGKS